ncbi:unnamed protein product [Rotaria sp. Silwood1]|nr:unnamed protein product [Rotaria sp. Silwood1]
MNEKKPINVTKSVNQVKSIDKKSQIPVLISYNKNDDGKNYEDNCIYYNNVQQCIETIKQSSVPIFLILNSSSATDILSRIHSLTQIDTIFIYCNSAREQQRCQYLCQHYSKIFDLFSDRNDYLRLAERYKQQNELNRALKYTYKALDIYRKTLSNQNHPLIARCLNNLGGIYDAQGDANRSFEFYEQAIKIYSHLTPSLCNQPVSNILKK